MKLERISRRLGVELYMKRDDLTGLLESGNKVRKLEFLVGDALDQGADTLITVGTLQSNCCRAVSAVAARLGLNAVVAVKGERPAAYDGNLLLNRMLGAQVHYLSDEEFRSYPVALEAIAEDAASMRDPRDREIELAFWESVRESSNRASIQAYLEKYPKGEFSTLAEIRLGELPTDRASTA